MATPAALALAGRSRARRGRIGLTAVALVAAALVALPVLTVGWSLTAPARDVWHHLWRTQLVELLANTAGLLLGVGVGVLVLGAGLGWLVVTCEFPGRRLFEWALVLPLALPAYVTGFVFLGLVDYAGPLQTGLRAWLGPGLRLPDPRSAWGVTLVMTLAFYPYVYTLARAALLEQAPEALESARVLGRTRLGVFRTVTLPLARPALGAGVALAGMEVLADFGTVSTFGYRTLTEAIYRVWHGMFDRLAATQLAAVLLGVSLLLAFAERASRGRARFTHGRRPPRAPARMTLRGPAAVAAMAAAGGVLLAAFVLPFGQLLVWAAATLRRDGLPPGLFRLIGTSLGLAGLAAALALGFAILLAYALRLQPTRLVVPSVRLAASGYALPGAVIAVGVLLPLAWVDHRVADGVQRILGVDPGLLLTGSAIGLLLGYLVRFLGVSLYTVEASLAKIPPNLDDAARSLGAGVGRSLRAVHLPLLRRGLLTAAALVFIDVMKELPATVLLRPFGLDTLAITVWQRTAESLWPEAAVPALALILASLAPVAIIVSGLTGLGPRRR